MKELLTATEQRIVAYSVLGYTRNEIAEMEYRSPYTIRRHYENIFTKLAVKSKAELTRWYLEHILKVDLTPLKKRIGAVLFILLILFVEINYNMELRRPVRNRISSTRGRRSKRGRDFEFDFEEIEIEEYA